MWFDNFLLTKGEAYTNTTGDFFYYDDTLIDSNYTVFGSPYKQWVSDSSIAGATVPTGVYINGNLSGRADGVVLDFDNGRALASGASSTDTVTGSFSVKDFNIYFTNDTEDDLIVENKYVVNSRVPSGPYTYITPYDDVAPAIFLAASTLENKPFALGGMVDTVVLMKAVVISDDPYKLDGALSIFGDSVNEVIEPVPMTGFPYTELGDLKGDSYNYTEVKQGYSDETPYFVDKVRTSKLSDRARKAVANELYIGFIDFDVQQHRYRFS
jgi:hypothetical protein|tara:strand:+ start:4357 stop:5163 length:807 start_codon:yes stop_codon:yes gene_type:complete